VALLPEMIDHLLQLAEVRTGFVHQLPHSAAGCPRRRKGQTTSFQLSFSAIPLRSDLATPRGYRWN
jgi:hypothetical protein